MQRACLMPNQYHLAIYQTCATARQICLLIQPMLVCILYKWIICIVTVQTANAQNAISKVENAAASLKVRMENLAIECCKQVQGHVTSAVYFKWICAWCRVINNHKPAGPMQLWASSNFIKCDKTLISRLTWPTCLLADLPKHTDQPAGCMWEQ